jgi:hypothetical protein
MACITNNCKGATMTESQNPQSKESQCEESREEFISINPDRSFNYSSTGYRVVTIPPRHHTKRPSDAEQAATPRESMHCCSLGCSQPAKWEIRWGIHPHDYTHACSEHLGYLLPDAPRYSVVPLTNPPTEHYYDYPADITKQLAAGKAVPE